MRSALPALATFCCALAFLATAAAQTVYKSVGPDGRVVYSDRPPTAGRLEKTMKFENLPRSALPAATVAALAQLHGAPGASPAPATAGVTLYSAAWCGYCRKAKAWLAGKGVAYQDVDVDTRPGMAALAQSGGSGGIPVLVVDGRAITGFSSDAYDAAFAGRK